MKIRHIIAAGLILPLALVAAFAGSPAQLAEVPADQVKKIEEACPAKATAKAKTDRKVLVIWKCNGFFHRSIPVANKAVETLGRKTGAYSVTCTDDLTMLEPGKIKDFDAVVLNNTTHLKMTDAQRKGLGEFVEGGKGLAGIHAASDNFYDWEEGAAMMGGLFNGHPWGAGGTWAVKIDEPEHIINRGFGKKAFLIKDEIYQIKGPYSRDTHRVLLSLDMDYKANQRGGRPDKDNAISWLRRVGKGRVFYCSLGHNSAVFWNPAVLQHYLDGIQYALGDLEADDTPTGKLPKAPTPATIAGAGEKKEASVYDTIASYEPGDDRTALAALDNETHKADPKRNAEIEQGLITVLKNKKSTYAGKQFACDVLRRIGSRKSVPALSAYLCDPDMSHMVRWAMQGMPCKEVDSALLEALNKAPDTLRPGIIGSLGARQCAEAVPAVREFAKSKDSAIAAASVNALGRIATADAANVLEKLRVPRELETVRRDSYIACVDALTDAGELGEAAKRYRKLYKKGDDLSKAAALIGLVRTGVDDAASTVVDALGAKQDIVCDAAKSALSQIRGEKATAELADELSKLKPESQVLLLDVLTERAQKKGATSKVNSLASGDGEVAIAALKSLAVLGDASSIDVLLDAMKKGGDAGNTARASLERLSGPGIDDALGKKVNSEADTALKASLIQVIAARGAASLAPGIVKMACDADASVRSSALSAAGMIGSASDVPALTRILVDTESGGDRTAALEAIRKIAERTEASDKCAEPVIKAYPSATAEAKAAMLALFPKIGSDKALGIVRSAANDKDENIRKAAVRAMTEWPNTSVMAEVKKLAANKEDLVQHVLAMRGYIRMIGLPAKRSTDDTAELYEETWTMATRVDEKKLVLGGVANVQSPIAFALACRGLDEPGCKGEAATAAIRTVDAGMKSADKESVKSAMEKAVKITRDRRLKGKAESVLKELDKD